MKWFGVFLALLASPAFAQTVSSPGVSVNTVAAMLPVPADSIPPAESPAGSPGATYTFRRGDAVQPRITRAGVATTDAGGNWTITFSTPMSVTPAVIPIAINSDTQPITCNVTTRSTTGASGRCFKAQLLPAALTLITSLISFNVNGGSVSGISVQVLAIPPTQ